MRTSATVAQMSDLPHPDRLGTAWEMRLIHLYNRRIQYSGLSGDMADEGRLALVDNRMGDAVFAASAIESCYLRITSLTRALSAAPVGRPMGKGLFISNADEPYRDNLGRVIPRVPDGYYDFHSMLWWGRALLNRVEGGWGERIRGEWVDHEIGLLRFLNRKDAARMRKAYERLRRGAFAEVKDLADYSLHVFAIPSSQAMLHLEDDGTYTLPLPDHLGRRPRIGERFTFEEGRNIGTEAEALWSGVQVFMADAFNVLEEDQLRREEAAPADRLSAIRAARTHLMPPPPD